MPATLENPQTFAAFEGKADGNTIKGVSLLQKGPALGHGVWIDDTTLSQAKKCAAACGRLKAKRNHWSGIEDTIGYYENFRVRSGKLTADLTLLKSHAGKDAILEMIEEIPTTFGVSISFQAAASEYDKEQDRYNARVAALYSADFVDTPAANRDGVFEAVIDNADEDMPAITPEAFEAYKTESANAIEALKAELLSAIKDAVKVPNDPVAPTAPDTALSDKIDALAAQNEALLKAFAAAPPAKAETAPVNEPEKHAPAKSYAEARKEAIGSATGLERIKAARAFDTQFASESDYVASFKK